MQAARRFSRFLFPALSGLVFLILACHLSDQGTVENTLSFGQRFDSLSRYDSLVIEVKEPGGKLLAVVFSGKPADSARLENLDVPGWDGGPIVIVITGFQKGKSGPVYQEEKRYDGKTHKTDTTVILVFPDPVLSAGSLTLTLAEGQRIALPKVEVKPANLAGRELRWNSENPGIVAVDGLELVGVSSGSARVFARLVADTARSLAFTVRVEADNRAPTRLSFVKDTLYVAQNGAPGWFNLRVEPASASTEVTWRVADSTLAAPRPDGSFQGLKPGVTQVWAASKLKPEIGATGWISVQAPQPVASVRFRKDSLIVYLGGAPESLEVEVLPLLAKQEVRFTLNDSTKAALAGSLLTPKAAGTFTVFVRSTEDTTKSDALPVTVLEPIAVKGVQVSEKSVTLYLGGPGRTLSAQVLPGDAPQGVRWKSLSPTLVSVEAGTGRIEALQAGSAKVVATSSADSSKRDTADVAVKADVPKLSVSADSLVSGGATVVFRVSAAQEYGTLVHFAWDLDGNGAWDDSLPGPWTGATADLPAQSRKYDQAGPVTARFRVRDSEGNVAVTTWTVRVVGGAAVSIDSPKDNSYTNQKTVRVDWSVNGKPQDSLRSEILAAIGPNVITRTARDSAGKAQTASITVYWDTTAPAKPNLSGSSPTNVKPKWAWSSGGGGGSGEYRLRLGDANFPADAPTLRDSSYTLAEAPVSGTVYTLFVQERDLAGNWSPSASLAIRYDITSPVVTIAAPQASGTYYTSAASASLSGTASGPVAISKVTYRVGTGAAANATFSAGNWSTPALALTEGAPSVVTVTATDQAGNTGEAALTLFLDATAPAAPTITAFPGASIASLKGTFEWTAGPDGTGGSGLNGHYRYAVNGGAWKDTTATLLANLPLAEGGNVFSVQEQDRAGNWSASASKSVRADTTGPAITLTSPASNPANSASLTLILSGQVKDTGAGVAAMTVAGQVSGSATVTVNAGTWSTASLTLKSGANALVLTATDLVGNARTLPVTVNVNIPAPVVLITNPADSLTITRFDTITVFYTIDGGAAQTKSFNLVDGVNRLVVASPANASGNIGRDTVKVTRDATPPNSPTLARGTTPTNGSATWTWTSRGDNTGGAGVRTPPVYRYSLDAGATWTQTSTAQYAHATEGTWTLIVQEQDKAGNWSASSAAQTIVVDKTPPSVAIVSPANNYVTRLGSVSVAYKVDNGANVNVTCNLTQEGANTCSASATDNAGNTGMASITVYRRANTYFVTSGGAGSGNGDNWENAMSYQDFSDAVASPVYKNKQFWVGAGTINFAVRPSYSMSIFGGFDVAKAPYDTAGRNPVGTRVTEYFQATPASDQTVMDFILDGFVLEVFSASGAGNTTTLNNIKIDPVGNPPTVGFYLPDNAVVTARNLSIVNSIFGVNAAYIGSPFNMIGGAITGNICDAAPVQVYSTMTLSKGATISGNQSSSDSPYQVRVSGGTLTLTAPVNYSCSSPPTVLDNGGTCK